MRRLHLRHLVDRGGHSRCDDGCLRTTAQPGRLRGGLISDLALRAVGSVLERAADLAQVQRRDVPVGFVVPFWCAAPGGRRKKDFD